MCFKLVLSIIIIGSVRNDIHQLILKLCVVNNLIHFDNRKINATCLVYKVKFNLFLKKKFLVLFYVRTDSPVNSHLPHTFFFLFFYTWDLEYIILLLTFQPMVTLVSRCIIHLMSRTYSNTGFIEIYFCGRGGLI